MTTRKPSKSLLFPLERKSDFLDNADTVAFTVFLDEERTDKMKFYAPIFREGTIEDWLEWITQLKMTFRQKSLGDDDSSKKFKLLKMLLAGQALVDYERLVDELLELDEDALDDNGNFTDVLDALTEKRIPENYSHQTREFLRSVKKPHDLSVEAFHSRILTINKYLEHMPEYRGLNDPLSNDALQTIFEDAMPTKWKVALTRTGRHSSMTFLDVVGYMRTMENLELELGSGGGNSRSLSSNRT